MTSKYALPSHQARKNSRNSPWRTQPSCPTKRAHDIRAKMNEEDRAKEEDEARLLREIEKDKRIGELEAENERLREKYISVITRMDRARHILTDGKPTRDNNWGMLDTSDLVDAAREGE